MRKVPTLSVVVPCYNEEEIIRKTISILSALFDDLVRREIISAKSFIVFVDDGSKDATMSVIKQQVSARVKALRLSNNVGHQNALLAGLHYVGSKCDCCISLDADLQDDISAIENMIDEYRHGAEIVYAVRRKRSVDTFFKRNTALLFYKVMKWCGIKSIDNHADFRLLSWKVLIALREYQEVNLFLRGIFPLMGYQSSIVYYDRQEREGSVSKYSLWKMARLAVNGITSFSNVPLKIITFMGVIIFIGSIGCSLWVVIQKMRGLTVPGWTSITLPIYFLGGIQLLAVGILGEYISKIYWESKRRPRYHIDEEADGPDQKGTVPASLVIDNLN